MPTIVPNQDFKHGRQTYEQGKEYEVSEGEAYYFTMCGWAGDGAGPSDTSVNLVVHDGDHGHESEVK